MPNSFDLGNQLESFIAELVKSGRYNSKSEASRGPAAAGARGSVRCPWMPPLPEASPMLTQAASSL